MMLAFGVLFGFVGYTEGPHVRAQRLSLQVHPTEAQGLGFRNLRLHGN